MKWYKKQLDDLKKKEKKSTPKTEKDQNSPIPQKPTRHSSFQSPVALRNKNRNKTDSK